ncbi:MAG: 5-formyltetrahydrofolate cyclo-ligase [Ruminococcus sp.]|nr:5-formyltetrahydrofolate cyclo-ligase [Ruminococcus sp.]
MSDMQDKEELRRRFSQLRKGAKSPEKDRLIVQRLLGEIGGADTVLIFASFGSEPDTWTVAEELLKAGRNVCFPRCRAGGQMTFHKVTELAQLVENPDSFGIREPDESLPCPVIGSDAVCIVPGLAFTEKGERLGYGGGFYDRFLAKNKVHTIALAYEECVTDTLPQSQHDLRVDMIVTEERTVLCKWITTTRIL